MIPSDSQRKSVDFDMSNMPHNCLAVNGKDKDLRGGYTFITAPLLLEYHQLKSSDMNYIETYGNEANLFTFLQRQPFQA